MSIRDRLITLLEADFIKKIGDKFLKGSKRNLLDIATGSGRLISQLESHFERSIGLDTSVVMISLARNDADRSTFVRGDAEHLPFNDNSFELVTCFRLFINLSKGVRKKFLLECKRILKNRGILVIDNHCNKIGLTGLLGALRGKLTSSKNNPFKLYSLMTSLQIKYELRLVGFKTCERMYTFLPTISHFPFISPLMQARIDQCLVRLPLLQLFADVVVIAASK
jgi:ubiquinone/menaquinone biosynthesis C-methylase UbiE